MKTLITSTFAACLALGSSFAMAQDTNAPASKAAVKADAKKDMSMQDCKDHANEMKGQKRTDPPTAETIAKCQDMKDGKSGMGRTKTDNTGSGSGSTMSK